MGRFYDALRHRHKHVKLFGNGALGMEMRTMRLADILCSWGDAKAALVSDGVDPK